MSVKKPRVFKQTGKQRYGRGFSRSELKEAGFNVKDALRFGVPVDTRRKTAHEENIKTVQAFLQEKKAASKPKKPKGKSKS